MTDSNLIYHGSEWDFNTLGRVYDAVESIAIGELGLDVYPNQIEVITSEQMLDAYASVGMPMMYSHWSFGKHFAREELLYRKGATALAYELVINSNPCVSYVMEENTVTMQTLVIAHAAFGHNHFFKNNHLFRQWTRADRVLDDLAYAKQFVAKCEESHGLHAVESVLDAAHALMGCGISRYAPKRSARASDGEAKAEARRSHAEATYNDLYRTLPARPSTASPDAGRVEADHNALRLPQENVLMFLAEHAPKLMEWQRELLRIVHRSAQYFYPQRQTKMMNEGCATFVHYQIMNRLYDTHQIDDGSMLEFLHSHSSVVRQLNFDDRRYSGLNPYAIGFAMMQDIQRICEQPDKEDRDWFPEIAGNGDAMGTLKQAWAEYRDESFVLQFLSPRLIRQMHLFTVGDRGDSSFMSVDAIHDESGYRDIRRCLASQYDSSKNDPDIEVTEADLSGSRRLVLTHRVRGRRVLAKDECNRVLCHVANLWGYRVRLVETDAETGATLNEYDVVAIP
ncbi:SpoVR family protein [Rubripirellula tenax]|uniref:SpoVR family protein n=1 Tax=Rubripirellula tenax TaxID=2528015 RepID=A0A5C6F3T7_9BACT|nr:SpoVR family protein [Rubripirellula tenax]TWU54666.1 SpoVR family protein [Rubripirellula tenax]